jgi:hypothetical protein
MEKVLTVSLPLVSISPSPFQFFPHSNFFQLNCSSVSHAGRPPLINKWIKGLLLPHLTANNATVIVIPHSRCFLMAAGILVLSQSTELFMLAINGFLLCS